MSRNAAVEVDLSAVRSNARTLAALAPDAVLCAVVKADGYGHGAVEVARAALEGGAACLAVAVVEEGRALRDHGIDAPIMLLSEPPPEAMADAHAAGLTPIVYTAAGIDAAAAAARGAAAPWEVHLKVDTGMHRAGADPCDAVALARRIVEHPSLRLGGTATHLAAADEPDHHVTADQLGRFREVLADLSRAGIDPGVRHAANSAGLLAHPDAHFDLVRVGIALYGLAPSPALEGAAPLQPAMTVRACVSLVRDVDKGEGVSYGLRHVFDEPAQVAVVPLGYADGVPRRLGTAGGSVLIGGVRRPIRGVVTMDQLMVEVTDGPVVEAGDEVVLLGRQGDEQITAQEWADLLDTISYEVVCGFGPRMPRVHLDRAPGRPG